MVIFLAFQIHRHRSVAQGVESLPAAATVEKLVEPAEPLAAKSHALEAYCDLLTKNGDTLEGQGVLVETLGGKNIIASHNSDHTFNPASVTKIATSLAALIKFGSDYRMRTTVY